MKPRSLLKIFITFFFITIFICFGIFAAVFIKVNFFNGNSEATIASNISDDESSLKKSGSFLDMFSSLPKRTVFVIFGVDDDGTRTDIMMLGCYNSSTKKINLISIPRDTYVVMPSSRRKILSQAGLWTPDSGAMKMNQVHHYAGKTYGVEFAVKQLEEMVGVKIQYYAKVNLEAFRYIIDEIGGVEYDVPQRMYYNDPEQNLYIDLQPGLQKLDGKNAEGLVRYREPDKQKKLSAGYARGDLQRIEVQQDFMKAVISQVFSTETIMNNIMPMINAAYKYVDTNFNLTDIPKYIKHVKNISSENIETCTIPCTNKMINGQSYVVIDEPEKEALIQSIFFDYEEVEDVSSKGLKIQVLNGAYTSGLAAQSRDMLQNEGFTIESIGDYSGQKQATDRIVVKRKGYGKDLQKYYPGSEIIVDSTLKDLDIIIILGTNH